MRRKKVRPLITEDRVPQVFSDDRINRLASLGKYPKSTDLLRFAKGLREAASDYAREVRAPNANELRDEIEALYGAACSKHYERAATLTENLSQAARVLLADRGRRPSLGIDLPLPKDFRDPAKREVACTSAVALCLTGGRWIAGRRLASGVRSQRWRASFHAPSRSRNFPKRKAELDFIRKMQATHLHAIGEMPPRTAHRNNPGPFARMVQVCLDLMGARDASAVDLINELKRRARTWEKTRSAERSLGAKPKAKRVDDNAR